MNYYKILNEEENHRGLQYKTGLNIDPVEFNPSGDCEPGGIYFASKDILAFLSYGPWIRKVTLPKDAKVYKSPRILEKWKADKVILGKRYKIAAKTIQKLIDEGVDLKINDSYVLKWAAVNGYLDIIKLVIKNGIDPKTDDSYALKITATNGYLKIVKFLIPLSDPKSDDNHALKFAATYGHAKVVKLLIDNGADPKADNSYALRWAAKCGRLKIVKDLIPVSDINEKVKKWIKNHCKDQEISNLILNYKQKE